MNKISENFKALKNLIQENRNFVVAAHMLPDGDSLGSTLAMGSALRKLGKQVTMICPDKLPEKYFFLPGTNLLQDNLPEEGLKDDTIVFILDSSDTERLGDIGNELKPYKVVNIDHHISNDNFGDINIVNTGAAATTEIIYSFLDELNLVDEKIAFNLFVGITTDTGSFKYANTTPATLKVSAELLSYGLQPDEISRRLFDEKPITTVLLLREVLKTLTLELDGSVAWLMITDDILDKCGAQREELDGMVNYANNIAGVEVGLLFYIKTNGEIKVGLRSKKIIDVAKVAEKFGGGGHSKAAGCRFYGADFTTAKHSILEEIGGLLKIAQH